MKLLSNWWEVLTKAWSMRFIYASVVFGALEYALPYFQETIPIPEKTFGAIALLLSGLAGVARIVAQSKMGESDEKAD